MSDVSVTSRVAERIRLLRAERRWSARQLAEACARAGMGSLTRSTIAKIESGVRKSVTADEIAVLAQVLGVTLSELIDGTIPEQSGERPRAQPPRPQPSGESGFSSPLLPRRRAVAWSREIPFRNPHFTGRERELRAIRDRLSADSAALISQPPQAIYGLGGVGKTEIAAEYCHRYGQDYDVVWWIRAEQEDTLRNALIALGQRLGLSGFRDQDREYSLGIVLDALRRGEPYDSWLLVFDNATDPQTVSRYIPQGPGHSIITSRVTRWRRALRAEGIEIAEFTTEEAVEFLRKRVNQLARVEALPGADQLALQRAQADDSQRDAKALRLAQALANLPLAAEHAAAYMNETGTSVDDYLGLFERNAHDLFSLDVDISYPYAVATAWSVSRETLSAEADALFLLLAFFAPEPISEELLVQPGRVQKMPTALGRVLGDVAEFRRAVRELHRFSLVKIDGVRNVILIHRVVQAITRDRLEREDPGTGREFRETVHALLAASDPGAPHSEENDVLYERSRQHLVPSGALESANLRVRALVINQMQHLNARGDSHESLAMGERALQNWRNSFGQDDLQTLQLCVEVGIAHRVTGLVEQAYELNADTLERLRRNYGEENETTLRCASSRTADLRLRGLYVDAINNDRQLLPICERVFLSDHLQTLNVRHDIATDLRCLGEFAEALEIDNQTYSECERTRGSSDRHTLVSMFAIARDLRQLGRYEESLDLLRGVVEVMEAKDAPWHLDRLLVSADFGIALRCAGFYADACEYGETTLSRHQSMLGNEHRQSLVVAANLINDRRLTGDLVGAEELGRATVASWESVVGGEHPNTGAAMSNLAVVLRVRGNPALARQLNERALTILKNALGEEHPNTLVARTNLASDLVALGEVHHARALGLAIVETSTRVRGWSHPYTLAAAANLALDRRACGEEPDASELHKDVLGRYGDLLSIEHPITRLAAQYGRINVEIEPMSS